MVSVVIEWKINGSSKNHGSKNTEGEDHGEKRFGLFHCCVLFFKLMNDMDDSIVCAGEFAGFPNISDWLFFFLIIITPRLVVVVHAEAIIIEAT